jgi:hypothetical protein
MNVLVQYAPPPGWRRRSERPVFVPDESKDIPRIELQVLARIDSKEIAMYKKAHPEWIPSPKYTFAFESLRESSPIRSIEKVGSFDGEKTGQLNLWQVHGDAYDVYIVLISEGHITVELSLRCDDKNLLKRYLVVLKDTARSVQIIRPAR